jgi:hypothetical protein
VRPLHGNAIDGGRQSVWVIRHPKLPAQSPLDVYLAPKAIKSCIAARTVVYRTPFHVLDDRILSIFNFFQHIR